MSHTSLKLNILELQIPVLALRTFTSVVSSVLLLIFNLQFSVSLAIHAVLRVLLQKAPFPPQNVTSRFETL